MIELFREPYVGGGYIIHAGSADGTDYTLCGYAEEGACIVNASDLPLEAVTRGRISCPRCCDIIKFCKAIPAKKITPSERRKTPT